MSSLCAWICTFSNSNGTVVCLQFCKCVWTHSFIILNAVDFITLVGSISRLWTPPPHKKKDIQLLFSHLKAKWHSTRLCLSLLPFAFVIYHFYAVVSVSTLTPYYKLIHFTFFTDRSRAERREAVRMEGCQRRHLCEPHQCTARLTSDVSSLAICLTPACKLVSGQFDNAVMPAL